MSPPKLTPYQRFMQDNIPLLKHNHPELTHQEAFKRIAHAWKFHSDNPKNKTRAR